MRFVFKVEVEVTRTEGKFATRDEISEQIMEALESADPGQIEGGEGGQYETAAWDVSEEPAPKTARKVKRIADSPIVHAGHGVRIDMSANDHLVNERLRQGLSTIGQEFDAARKARMERDCMRCEQTFTDDGTHDFCPACRKNPNRIDIGGR
jgi:Zn finger protein HypA/HybF involved in hydrogenase expression